MEKNNLFIKQVIDSIKNFDSYKRIYKCKLSASFIYFFILIAIYSIIATIGVVHNTRAYVHEVQDFVNSELSEITYENRTFEYK